MLVENKLLLPIRRFIFSISLNSYANFKKIDVFLLHPEFQDILQLANLKLSSYTTSK